MCVCRWVCGAVGCGVQGCGAVGLEWSPLAFHGLEKLRAATWGVQSHFCIVGRGMGNSEPHKNITNLNTT